MTSQLVRIAGLVTTYRYQALAERRQEASQFRGWPRSARTRTGRGCRPVAPGTCFEAPDLRGMRDASGPAAGTLGVASRGQTAPRTQGGYWCFAQARIAGPSCLDVRRRVLHRVTVRTRAWWCRRLTEPGAVPAGQAFRPLGPLGRKPRPLYRAIGALI